MRTLLSFISDTAYAQGQFQIYCNALGNYCGPGAGFLVEIAYRVWDIATMIAGGASLLAFVYGAILVIASGLEDKKEEGKKIMVAALSGLILAGMSFGIVQYVCSIVDTAAGSGALNCFF